MKIKALLTQRVEAAFNDVGIQAPALVQLSNRPEFGDYQANGVMAAAKKAGKNPRELAQTVVKHLDLSDIAADVSIAGPGFINIVLARSFLARNRPAEIIASEHPQTVVVDYSAPNLAKEMHIGHIRSTIIGDGITRILEALGHTVIRQNHVGDWGTQFGMLLTYLAESGEDSDELGDIENFYRAAKTRFDDDRAFQDRCRQAVVDLQSGDADAYRQWQRFIAMSAKHCQALYDRLDVTLTEKDLMGESAYNDDLHGILAHLQETGLLSESDGAQCVFLDEFTNKEGEPLPLIVQKSDGGFLYATTDLAAIQHRVSRLKADRALYFVDARQALHFKQVFAAAAAAGLTNANVRLQHLPFGTMLGKDGKPFKTRTGGVVKLNDLLDEAENRALTLVQSKNPDLSETEAAHMAHVIGIGAVKYADLSKNRTSDYVFDWDQMLSLEGNTAPYLQYAYSRIQSLFTKGDVDPSLLSAQVEPMDEPERLLAVALVRFNDTLEQIAEEGYPHYLCAYLYDVAGRFTQFYEQCPVLSAQADTRTRRLTLCQHTALTLQRGLDLLGIGVVQRM